MTEAEIGSAAIVLSGLLLLVHCLGHVFERLRQPRLIGEILAGVLLGPQVLGGITAPTTRTILEFLAWIGVLSLMFLSGTAARTLVTRDTWRTTAWLLVVGTTLPFLAVIALVAAAPWMLDAILADAGDRTAGMLVLATAVSVTSIPVLSRIFADLRILHTRFASLILGTAVLEDILLWGVLAVATALAGSAVTGDAVVAASVAGHSLLTLGYMLVGLFFAPALLRRLHTAKWNVLMGVSPAGYVFVILFGYVATASLGGINLVFAAFLAGYGLVGSEATGRQQFAGPLEAIGVVARSLFIPLYFAMVGYRLLLGGDLSLTMIVVFLLASSALAIAGNALAAWLAGFRRLDVVNIAVTTNARGGPGIVLASVAYGAGIINAPFYTTLVLTSILTSQAAGVWLRYVLDSGRSLLSADAAGGWTPAPALPGATAKEEI